MEIVPAIQYAVAGVAAMNSLFSQIRELLKESSNLIDPVKELIDRLLQSTSCKEDKQQLIILRNKIEEFEEKKRPFVEQDKQLEELISLSEMCEMWLSQNQKSLADQATNFVSQRHAELRDSDKQEISKRITDYLYLIHSSLHGGEPTLIDEYFQENPSSGLHLSPIYYKEALNFIIDEKAPHFLASEATMIAKAYFDHLMKKLPP